MSTEPTSESPPDPGCDVAMASLARFVRRSLPSEEARAFRAHLTACTSCSQLYRQTLSTAARTSRQRRARLAEESRIARREEARRRVFAAGRAKPNRFGLRLAILPALVILALMGFGPFAGPPALVLAWERGVVRIGEENLGSARAEEELGGGEYVSLGEGAAATLSRGVHRLELVGESLILVPLRPGPDVRLVAGQLEFEGTWNLSTVHGVLASETGRGHLRNEGGRFELSCLEGEVHWLGPLGSRTLQAGESWNSEAALREGP